MRAAWGDLKQDPPYAKLADNGITWPYFDIRDPRLTPAYLDSVKAHAGIKGCGVYSVRGSNSWPETHTMTPTQFAEWTDARLKQIDWLGNLPVMFDIEVPNLVPYVLATLRRWRELRPKRVTDLTIEGHKGGLFTLPDVRAVAGLVRWTVPQCYDSTMTPWDTWAVCFDLYARGFMSMEVRPFYDAAALQPWWGTPDGFAFTWGRLP